MNLAVRLSLAAAGLFPLVGVLSGVAKYRAIMRSPAHRAPVYDERQNPGVRSQEPEAKAAARSHSDS